MLIRQLASYANTRATAINILGETAVGFTIGAHYDGFIESYDVVIMSYRISR